VCLFTIRFFGGQIYKFSPSSGGHAPVSCVRRQSLVLQPLSTAVRSLGDRRMALYGGSGDDRRLLALQG
jgi:hypothetical protein